MMASDPRQRGLHAWARFLDQLSPATLPGLPALVTDEVRFRDPFNDVRGVAAVMAVFEKMYADVTDIRFTVSHVLWDREALGLIRWQFLCRPKTRLLPNPWQVEGTSEIHLAAGGRVAAHLDHWDASTQFYAHLPGLGAMIRFLRRRLAA
jgi:steroid Delta-isomerase